MTRQYKKEKGVILVEAIVAVGVLVTIFTASMSLFMVSTKGVRINNDQLIATFLAQDAMEIVVAKRQYNFNNDLSWLDGMACAVGAPCEVDFDQDITQAFPVCTGNCSPLNVTGQGVYTTGAGTPTIYTREVVIETLPSPNDFEAQVTVTVSWNEGSNRLQYPLRYNIYDNPPPHNP